MKKWIRFIQDAYWCWRFDRRENKRRGKPRWVTVQFEGKEYSVKGRQVTRDAAIRTLESAKRLGILEELEHGHLRRKESHA